MWKSRAATTVWGLTAASRALASCLACILFLEADLRCENSASKSELDAIRGLPRVEHAVSSEYAAVETDGERCDDIL